MYLPYPSVSPKYHNRLPEFVIKTTTVTHGRHITLMHINISRRICGCIVHFITALILPAHRTLGWNPKVHSLSHSVKRLDSSNSISSVRCCYRDSRTSWFSPRLTQCKLYWNSLLLTLAPKFHSIILPINIVSWLVSWVPSVQN